MCYDCSKVNFQTTMIHVSAIQFVLSADEFSNLRQEERQALLHVRKFWICLNIDYNNYYRIYLCISRPFTPKKSAQKNRPGLIHESCTKT